MKKIVAVNCILIAVTAALCRIGCPIYRLTGIACPTCGVTRAWISFLHLRFREAFAYHPLFLPIPAFLFIAVNLTTGLFRPKTQERLLAGCIGFAVLLFAYRLYRTVV